MRFRTNAWCMVAGFVLAGLVLGAAAPGMAADKDKVSFKWAFIHRSTDGSTKVVDFSERPSIASGESLRVYLEPLKNSYIYVYMFSAQKELSVIFPKTPSVFDEGYKMNTEYVLPGKARWFVMDDKTGTERFYLLASAKRLVGLEKITEKYLADQENAELKAKVLDEIKNVRKAHSSIAAPAEKSVPIAGSVVTVTRGDPPGQVTEVEAETFYSKTLRLKHE